MKARKNPYKPTGKNELTPGQVKDLGKSNFFRIESKKSITEKELNDIRDWLGDSLNNPYSIQKGYGNFAFRNTGKLTSNSYIFYFCSQEDLAYFKLLHPEIVNG